jgi:hypothetical protein
MIQSGSSYSGFLSIEQEVPWRFVIAITILVLIVVVALGMALRKLGSQDKFLVYRRVISRKPAADGSNGNDIVLECGHHIRLIHQEREMFPCDACKEAIEASKRK